MEPMLMPEAEIDLRTDEEILIHEWRAEQLRALGLSPRQADKFADRVDWREVAVLVQSGCPAELAIEIVR